MKNKFIPILPNVDSLSHLTTSKPRKPHEIEIVEHDPAKVRVQSYSNSFIYHETSTERPQSITIFHPMNQQENTINANDTWEVNVDVPNDIIGLINQENQSQNVSKLLRMKKVTQSRSAHRDEDIFIARVNNPFGHSTKWKLRYDY